MIRPPLSTEVAEFWKRFLAAEELDPGKVPYDVFRFGDDEKLATELVSLVLEGRKRATTTLLREYEIENQPIPKAGDLSVVTDWSGRPKCVIRTTQVDVLEFSAVTAEFAAIEGEGDKSLSYWQETQRRYFTRQCELPGEPFSDRSRVVCEQFSVASAPVEMLPDKTLESGA